MKKMACSIYVAKTKALIRCAITAKLICVFVFAYVDCWLSYVTALLCCFCKYHCAQKMNYDSKSVENLIDCDRSMLLLYFCFSLKLGLFSGGIWRDSLIFHPKISTKLGK